jgi:hypothetical protein
MGADTRMGLKESASKMHTRGGLVGYKKQTDVMKITREEPIPF